MEKKNQELSRAVEGLSKVVKEAGEGKTQISVFVLHRKKYLLKYCVFYDKGVLLFS